VGSEPDRSVSAHHKGLHRACVGVMWDRPGDVLQLRRRTPLQYHLLLVSGPFGRRSVFSWGVSMMEIYEASVSLMVRALASWASNRGATLSGH